ncbi:hypothetical protein [Epibacterium sp. Ofav1-8]|uniref:hypothetical protein n=1 Tax=Epibacterium sp. Ofav1-8 TaxID=2917735 RepID=UPI001EF6FED5|nr:hypothetical protein [Epibacterium sp. Ofav1-8]MCG7625032.1 hypothetical protein [Epibacterium sp. Ofav1-8]
MFKEAQTTEAAGSRISTRTHARDEATWEKKRDDRCQQGADLIPKPIAGVAREVLSRLRQGCLRLADGIEALVPDALGTRTYLQGRSGKFVAAVFFARHKQTQPVHPKKPGMRINRHAIFRLLFTCGIAFMSAT